ncbi:ATP-binding protein [Cellulomonas sp. RIT-PI-Y]|uniref:ATP-binding protein n=1 Tax=Cellulomonas sp. RIT-PI-Y TaxID=3035297 RepID=UPI0021DA5E55|nr:ATP-binding protein [Cellulomonas sp. RIT-PI-Y]
MSENNARTDDGLVTARPPERFELVREWVLHDVDHLSGVRRELLEAVTASDAGPQRRLDDVPERMILVASELATNALTHGLPPTTVRLFTDGDDYLLDVADHDIGSTPFLAGERPPGAGGFGLQIARRLSQQVGWYATEHTKHVWAIFPAQR